MSTNNLITQHTDEVCEISFLPECDTDALLTVFTSTTGANPENTKDSGFVKVPGDRVQLETDVCPMRSGMFTTIGTRLSTYITDLETELTFDEWLLQRIWEKRIPEIEAETDLVNERIEAYRAEFVYLREKSDSADVLEELDMLCTGSPPADSPYMAPEVDPDDENQVDRR